METKKQTPNKKKKSNLISPLKNLKGGGIRMEKELEKTLEDEEKEIYYMFRPNLNRGPDDDPDKPPRKPIEDYLWGQYLVGLLTGFPEDEKYDKKGYRVIDNRL